MPEAVEQSVRLLTGAVAVRSPGAVHCSVRCGQARTLVAKCAQTGVSAAPAWLRFGMSHAKAPRRQGASRRYRNRRRSRGDGGQRRIALFLACLAPWRERRSFQTPRSGEFAASVRHEPQHRHINGLPIQHPAGEELRRPVGCWRRP